MAKSRAFYFTLICITIITGLLSRHFSVIPLFIGDILWALMVYYMLRFLFIAKPLAWAVNGSLLFSFAIEFSQLYKAPWIDGFRQTLFGRLVLGDTFLWSDLLFYTVGIGFGVVVDQWLVSRK